QLRAQRLGWKQRGFRLLRGIDFDTVPLRRAALVVRLPTDSGRDTVSPPRRRPLPARRILRLPPVPRPRLQELSGAAHGQEGGTHEANQHGLSATGNVLEHADKVLEGQADQALREILEQVEKALQHRRQDLLRKALMRKFTKLFNPHPIRERNK
ncbi:hypothetical protein KKF05_05810, partial [Patescibacteria group bacterium]|nr:hypothetical protein [Patescibacteria group bacterium]